MCVSVVFYCIFFFFFKQKTAYEMSISDWSSDVCSSDLGLIAPVLTAHPTEVRRKSMIDHRNRIADLMALKDRGLTATPDGDDVDEAITRQIALLWQTRVLRREKQIGRASWRERVCQYV